MAVQNSLYKKFFSLKKIRPVKIVTKTADCLMEVMMVTSLAGFAFAIKSSLSPNISEIAISGIQ